MLLGVVFSLPLVFPPLSPPLSPAQSPSPASSLNPQQWSGRRLFLQNCALCHLSEPDNPKSTAKGSAYGGDLSGLFNGQRPMTEEAVQAFILRGLPNRMPGFQYGLKRQEIDTIIAYLRTL
jgi:mono/diheme cytochrome c family protein